MSLDLSSVSLPFDRWGNAASNKLENERHTLTSVNWTEYNIIIPKYAPFYSESITHLIHLPSGRHLERGRDWHEGWYFQSASGEIGLDIHCCIYFYDPHLTGEVEIPSYQAMGGEHQINSQLLTKILADALLNPLRYYWEQIAELPQIFNPLDHDQDIEDFTRLGDLINAVEAIATALGGTDDRLPTHLMDRSNPHGTDKNHVGLGLLNNWPMAAVADIIAGQLNPERYMNPVMTYQMIENIALAAIAAHASDVGNPHNTRANQTGAYFINEVDALMEALAAGLIHDLQASRLEGKTVADIVGQAIQAVTDQVDQIRQDFQATIEATLEGFQADDASKFAGQTEGEWREVIRQVASAEANALTFLSVEELIGNQTPESTYSIVATGNTITYLGDIDAENRDGEENPIGRHDAYTNIQVVMGDRANEGAVGCVIDIQSNRTGSAGRYWTRGTPPPGLQIFTDAGTVPGRRRLFLRAGPNRTALEVLVASTTGFWPSDGLGIYNEGAENAWGHTDQAMFTADAYATAASVSSLATTVAQLASSQGSSGTRLNALTRRVDDLEEGNSVRYAQTRSIPAGSSISVDMHNLVPDPDDVELFDFVGARINVMVVDNEVGSPTNGSYINSEALITKAIRGSRYLDLYNHTGQALSAAVRIELPLL